MEKDLNLNEIDSFLKEDSKPVKDVDENASISMLGALIRIEEVSQLNLLKGNETTI